MVLNTFFLHPAGLLTALVLIPFLLLYLIRPKPRHERIPSLLFIMKDVGKTNAKSFFRTFLKDVLFLLQLLILLLLIAAAAKPYVEVPRRYLAEETVILIDVSASMQAGGRFAQAKELALENLGKKNTIITITSNPAILLDRGSAGQARDLLSKLEPMDTTTSLSDAINLAASHAGAGTRVVIISDFIATAGDRDFETAAALLESAGAMVEYLPVQSSAKNVGIIDLQVGPVTSKLWVKNYKSRPRSVTLKISDAEQQLLLAPGETREVSFQTPPGVAKITIPEKDDFPVDNTVWTSTPAKNKVAVLVITNNKGAVEQSRARLAMQLISENFPTKFLLEYAEPPRIPKLHHDLYLFDNANPNLILPGHIKDIKRHVEDGASLIVFSQPAIFSLDWQGLLPVVPLKESQGTRGAIIPEKSVLTQDIAFGQVNEYLRVKAVPNATVITSVKNDPVIVLKRLGKGFVLYYGLDDKKASFSRDPSYPVFWRRVLDRLTHRPSIENLNVHTGGILAFPVETHVKTPRGVVKGKLVPLNYVGVYTYRDRSVAVNLLSDEESSLTTSINLTRASTSEKGGETEKAPKEITNFFLIAALILLFLEILYVKYRGDF